MKKKASLPTIFGLIILVVATFLGVVLVQGQQIFRLGAEGEASPKDIRISNINDSSFTVSWMTDKETVGFIVWGESESTISKIEKESDEKSYTHNIVISNLSPQKKYFFKINSDGTLYDNKGIAWQTSTGASLGVNRETSLLSGSVIIATGQPVKKALVYVNVGGYLFSTLTSDSGNYVFQLANTRTQDLNGYLQIDKTQTLVEIFIQAPPSGVSSAQIFPQSGNPVPPIIVGQTHDFRSLPPSSGSGVPNANLSLPQDSGSQSKFSVPDNLGSNTQEVVTLENISENEKVTSVKPEFFGDGPEGQTFTIKVESENPIIDDVTVSSNGSWKWSPPENLAPGAHKITITWKDLSGITRSLTRNFVVQAGEAPAFEASSSQNLSTSNPSPTPSSTPTTTPIATLRSTPPPTPATGSLTPTLLLLALSGGVFIFSFASWKYSK